METKQQKAIDAIFRAMDKKYGGKRQVVTTMAAGNQGLVNGVMPTGLEAVDRYLLGIGGLCWERITEVFGPESSGKSSFVMGCTASVQRKGGVGFYLDAENALTQERALTMGVDKDSLIMAPDIDSAEHAGDMLIEAVLATPKDVPFLGIVDSVAVLETEAEVKEGSGMSAMARYMSGYLKKLVRLLKGRAAHVIFVNQIREKPGVMFGSPEYTPGGKALKFYASTRLRTRGVKKRDGGLEIIIKAVKNKLSEPGRELETFLHFKQGWDDAWTTLNHAKELKAVPNTSRDHQAARKALGWPAAEAAERLGAVGAAPGKAKAAKGK